MIEKDGGPAFPHGFVDHGREQTYPSLGMSLRDYFAAKALQGQLAAFADEQARLFSLQNAEMSGRGAREQVAVAAYEYADEMLKAREAK